MPVETGAMQQGIVAVAITRLAAVVAALLIQMQ